MTAEGASGEPELLDFVRGTRLKVAGLKVFKKGSEVSLHGFYTNAALNGQLGTIAGFDDARKRWAVDLGEGLGKKLLLETNLRLPAPPTPSGPAAVEGEPCPPPALPAAAARDESPPPLGATPRDGSPPPLVSGRPREGVKEEKEEDSEEVVDLFEGARVSITGLSSNFGELNGKAGTILAFSREKGRWVVELDGGLGKKMFKDCNLTTTCSGARGAAAKETSESSAKGKAAPASSEVAQFETPAAAEQPPPPQPQPQPQQQQQLAPVNRGPPRPLKPGAQVLVDGLEVRHLQHLNGHVGICEHIDYMTGCWTVTFLDESLHEAHALRPEYLVGQPATLRPGAYVRILGTTVPHLNGKLAICEKLDPETLRWSVCLENGDKKTVKPENLEPQDSYLDVRHRDPSDNVSSLFEEALSTGEISWLDY